MGVAAEGRERTAVNGPVTPSVNAWLGVRPGLMPLTRVERHRRIRAKEAEADHDFSFLSQ